MRRDVINVERGTRPRKAGALRSGHPFYIYKLTLRCGHVTEREEKHPKVFEWADCKECDVEP